MKNKAYSNIIPILILGLIGFLLFYYFKIPGLHIVVFYLMIKSGLGMNDMPEKSLVKKYFSLTFFLLIFCIYKYGEKYGWGNLGLILIEFFIILILIPGLLNLLKLRLEQIESAKIDKKMYSLHNIRHIFEEIILSIFGRLLSYSWYGISQKEDFISSILGFSLFFWLLY